MSLLEKWLAGWSFRTRTPAFDPGRSIEVMVTAMDGDHAIARIGDSTFQIDGTPNDALHTGVLVDIEQWEADTNTGRGTYRETVGTSSF